jgi:elongation factor G
MGTFSTKQIRNVCIAGHGGAGKTTLAEGMIFNTGVLDRLGKVLDGNTTMDFDPEEVKRKVSINTAVASCEWKGFKINLVDTPGYFDFIGELKQGMRVVESVAIVLPAKGGVAVGTEKVWDEAKENSLPRCFFINKMDEENADFDKVFRQIQEVFGKGSLPFFIPIMEKEKFIGILDVLKEKAYKFEKEKVLEISIPENYHSKFQKTKEQFNEVIAESDESLMEKFFEEEAFTKDEIEKGIKNAIANCTLFPVFCGVALENVGLDLFMDALVEYMPSPEDLGSWKATNFSGETITISPKEDTTQATLVFKTIADPFVGKISMVRVYSGTLNSDSRLINSRTGKIEKIHQLFFMRGKKNIPIDKLLAGDMGAVTKLSDTSTNDTLCDPSQEIILRKILFPKPNLSLAVIPKAKGDEEKIGAGLHKLLEEDPTFCVINNPQTHQLLISGMGEQHLDVIVSKLKEKFHVSVQLMDPKIPFREAIKKKVKVEGKHKKQSGGHGQFGHVWIEFEPGEEEGLDFREKIFGGAVPKQYIPAVEKGLLECIKKGVLAGYPVVKLKATLIDGSYHAVDSSEMAFKIASSLAYKKGLAEANPVMLEPIYHVEVNVPDPYMGDVIGDINKRRGRILGMNPIAEGLQKILAEAPLMEMFKYAIDLRSMTQGRGSFDMRFERYEELPSQLALKVIEETKKNLTEEGFGD